MSADASVNFAERMWGRLSANLKHSPVETDMASIAQIPPKIQAGSVQWFLDCVEKSKNGVITEITTLTPGLAGELLQRNSDNRSLRPAKAAQYANDIRSGRWTFNGEPIIISDTGELNDGQHRAWAVADANTPIPVLMVFGVPRDTRTTIDQGAARTAGDYLTMDGIPNGTVQAALARNLLAFERSEGTSLLEGRHVTNAEVMERALSDLRVAKSASFAACHAKPARAFAPPSVVAFCHYIFFAISPDQAETYMDQVCRGEGLRARDPAYTVRERLVSLGSKSREKRIHIIIRGWNAFRQGRSLTIAKIAGEENIPAAI